MGGVAGKPRLLVLVLQLVELPVESAVGEQLLVRAHLAQLPFVHDQDHLGALDCRQAVRDKYAGAAFDHALEGPANAQFRVGIDAGGRFVQDENTGIVGQRAGKINELLLARRQRVAALLHRLIELAGQALDEIQNIDIARGLDKTGFGDGFVPQADVFGDGSSTGEPPRSAGASH
jgi:hypothetical protein